MIDPKERENYCKLAKGAPAMIMGNGLMPTLAFYKSKGKEDLLNHILGWLGRRYQLPQNFNSAMDKFFKAESSFYMQATNETLALLRWIRQFADAQK